MSAPGVDTDRGRIPDADWIAAGFRWFAEYDPKPGRVGFWQTRVRDGRGTAYFVNVFVWDWRPFDRVPYRWSYEQDDQFMRGDDVFNFSRPVSSPDDALAFAAEVWSKLGCDHYEEDWTDPTAPQPGAER